MGYDVDRFVSDIDEELKCPICCGVLEDPVQGAGCEHAYCRRCIVEWMKTSESCPVDRNPLKPSHLEIIPRIVRNLLNHLHIKCEFDASGCREVTKLEDLPNHRVSCSFNPEFPIPCPKSCGAFVPKNLIDGHDCIRDLRSLLNQQQHEIAELKTTISDLFCIASEQREIARNNNHSLTQLSERYDHLKSSIQNLEQPIRTILRLTNGPNSRSSRSSGSVRNNNNRNRSGSDGSTNSSNSDEFEDDDLSEDEVKEHLGQETTTEVYISNVDRSVTPGTLQDYLMRRDINVISSKEALCRGWKNDFKVTVFKSDVSKILSGSLWPKGIVVFVCGEYYSTKVEGVRDTSQSESGQSSSGDMKGAIPPWMMMS